MPKLPKQPKTRDKRALHAAWSAEQAAARDARATGDTNVEWAHLERAHIISQPLAVAHVRTHLAMLSYGWRRRDRHEIAGQLARVLVAGPDSLIRRYPRGNTGGGNVSAVLPIAISDDLTAVRVSVRGDPAT
jgi:hypothetical protein